MPICAKLPLESGPALGTLSLCLKTGIIPSTSMAVSLTEGAVLKGLTQETSSSRRFAGKTRRYTATSGTPAAQGSRSISAARSTMRMTAHPPGAGKATAAATITGTRAAAWTLSGLEATITPKASQRTTTRPLATIPGGLRGDAYYLLPLQPRAGPPSTLSACAGRAARRRSRRRPPSRPARPCLCT